MVMVVGAVSAVDISDIVGDFSGHRITCGRVEMKGFIEVTTENGTHLLNMKYIEDVWEDEDGECTIRFEDGTPDDRDTELEYIESSGTQYVDTGVVPNNKGGVHYIDKNRIEAAVKTLRRRTERGEDR